MKLKILFIFFGTFLLSTNGVAQNKNTENQLMCAEEGNTKICIEKRHMIQMTQQWPKFSECKEKANSYEKDYVTFMTLKSEYSNEENLTKSFNEMINSCSNITFYRLKFDINNYSDVSSAIKKLEEKIRKNQSLSSDTKKDSLSGTFIIDQVVQKDPRSSFHHAPVLAKEIPEQIKQSIKKTVILNTKNEEERKQEINYQLEFHKKKLEDINTGAWLCNNNTDSLEIETEAPLDHKKIFKTM